MNFMKRHPAFFFSKSEKQRIISAVREAEKNTSGEIRVHLERRLKGDMMAEARKVFERIGMTRTKDRNGVLILLVIRDRRVAILGDKGIHEKVPADFWEREIRLMENCFRENEFAEGIALAVLEIGEKLREFFPFRPDDQNELPDGVSH
ncbi:MAG: hypothetical protein BWY42_01428 [Candidatus Omnitrophica bacterium ADurb.Bin277]|nr:MAG: hypothetical protein BWY42_01428 [Candidatus Omnitrophica bacterium ADurb.Bin277]